MTDPLLDHYPIVLGLALSCLSIAMHEVSHYLVARHYGASPRFAIKWSNGPNPAVRINLRALRAPEAAVTALAPGWILLSSIPLLLLVGGLNPTSVPHEHLFWIICWVLGGIPSPSDLRMAVNAYALEVYRDVWYGDHSGHRAAEGIV